MKKKKWIDVLIIFCLIAVSVIIRSYYMSTVSTLTASGNYLTEALNVNGGRVPLSSFDMKGIYTWLLAETMLFFGRKSIFALYLNIAIQTLDIILIYGCFRLISGRLISSIVAILVSAIPFFYQTITEISPYNLTNCFIVFCIYILVLVGYLIATLIAFVRKKRQTDEFDEDVMEASSSEDLVAETAEEGAEVPVVPSKVNEELEISVEETTREEVSLKEVETSRGNKFIDEVSMNEASSEESAMGEVTENEMKQFAEEAVETSIDKPAVPKTTIIEPPLPMPKKHVKKEMSYAFDPKFDMMHYDMDDMTGIDFYDIE